MCGFLNWEKGREFLMERLIKEGADVLSLIGDLKQLFMISPGKMS